MAARGKGQPGTLHLHEPYVEVRAQFGHQMFETVKNSNVKKGKLVILFLP